MLRPLVIALFALQVTASPQATETSTSTSTTSTGSSGSSITSVSPEQSSAFSSATKSYYRGLTSAPDFRSLFTAFAAADLFGGDNIIASIRSNPSLLLPVTGTPDLLSLATAIPTSFPSYSWFSRLDPTVVSSIRSLQTSGALAVAYIDQSVLGTSAQITFASSSGDGDGGSGATTSTSNAGVGQPVPGRPTGLAAAAGAAVGAFGMAVVLL